MKNNTIEVFVNEEYGYRTWIWHPNMTEDEFVAWWNNLTETDIIKYYFNIKSLCGKIKPHTVKDPVLSDDNTNGARMWGDPSSHRPYYYCHFHDVDDSFIEIGNQRYPFRRTTRRDWKEQWIDWSLKNDKSPV